VCLAYVLRCGLRSNSNTSYVILSIINFPVLKTLRLAPHVRADKAISARFIRHQAERAQRLKKP
jgi:hypothetical protein